MLAPAGHPETAEAERTELVEARATIQRQAQELERLRRAVQNQDLVQAELAAARRQLAEARPPPGAPEDSPAPAAETPSSCLALPLEQDETVRVPLEELQRLRDQEEIFRGCKPTIKDAAANKKKSRLLEARIQTVVSSAHRVVTEANTRAHRAWMRACEQLRTYDFPTPPEPVPVLWTPDVPEGQATTSSPPSDPEDNKDGDMTTPPE